MDEVSERRVNLLHTDRAKAWSRNMRSGSVCFLLVLLVLPVPVLSQGDLSLSDAVDDQNKRSTTTVKPRTPVHGTGGAGGDLNLEDALDPKNDIVDTNKNKKPGGEFSDGDLSDVLNDKSYKPDKGKGGHHTDDTSQNKHHDENNGTMAEVGTIAGIISAVSMALFGAISSYISYQKKKFCFSIQQSLNTDLMAENPEAVVATEPNDQKTPEATKC
ncbi:CD99 antigen-like protein 2 [Kryptolebias marmoratus]|uniref:CD99 antigen-like protein 2 n=1 Tax=Kryptolebias marmoratus TaxID=37003 RepID=A0A3Q3A2F8_KRYMA|nr:CD99 antigen-like protein 2 [Kryptolebias marmoratus]